MTNIGQTWKIACRGLIIDQGQLLTVKLKVTDDFYCLPGGKLDIMETLENCIAREIYEELGVQGVVGPLLFIHQGLLEQHQKHMIEFFYLITNGSDFRDVDLTYSSHGFEISDIKRVELDDITVNLMPGFIIEYLKNNTIDHIVSMGVQSVVSH